MKLFIDIDQLAKQYHNGFTPAGIPVHQVYTFGEFVDNEMKKKKTAICRRQS